MKTKIGIEQNLDAKSANELAVVLAMEFVFYTITRNAHLNWGDASYNDCNYFKDQFKQVEEIIDDLANRIVSLNNYTPGCLNELLKFTRLAETVQNNADGKTCMKEMLHNHESIIGQLHEKMKVINLQCTGNSTTRLITQIIQQHERMACMLRSHLQ